jgi:hypothetical protein
MVPHLDLEKIQRLDLTKKPKLLVIVCLRIYPKTTNPIYRIFEFFFSRFG